jgi:Putative beta-barrel porin-2, OmpL-like. bbp2
MKLSKLAMIAAVACGLQYGNTYAAQNSEIQLVSCDCGEPACGCEVTGPACDSGCEAGGCNGGCDSACGCGTGCDINLFGAIHDKLACCDLGEPWTLFGEKCGWSAGGWVQTGYHTKALPIFNDRPDEYNLHQAWLYAEKAIDTDCGFDIGGRIDYVYGIDAQNTQAFGIPNDHWDNGWDNGQYGHAIPQAYAEMGYGDLSVKLGHFYTIIGYEVVQATGNFFYSHAYTFNFSEPFTHTGALATYKASDDVTLYSGYVMGWDSGFEDNGDAFLGGTSLAVDDDLTLTYATVFGRLNENGPIGGNQQGYMQSIVANYSVSDRLNYIFQTDLLDTENAASTVGAETFDINQYLLYSLNDCWGVGSRFEWYDVNGTGVGGDVYALTAGLNYRPSANLIIRPEIRNDWQFGNLAGTGIELAGGEDNLFTFGVDSIFTF